jgi:tRNA (guanine37-N1)-methyltransferase
MWCGVVTLFPEMFSALNLGITGRAIEKGLINISYWNPRDWASNRHKTVDDRPYGGGPGMLMSVSPLREAIQAAKAAAPGLVKTIYVSPQGKPFQQETAKSFIVSYLTNSCDSYSGLILVAGRYEGIDERLIELEIDEEWSLGDYVLSGGELPIMVMLDAMIRLIPGALGHEDSANEDSFSEGLLDCPHYTRPEEVAGLGVPEVLLSGNHAAIAEWRLKQRLGRTYLRRKDLLDKLSLDKNQEKLLQEFLLDHKMLEDL